MIAVVAAWATLSPTRAARAAPEAAGAGSGPAASANEPVRLSPWQSKRMTPFVSSVTDLGIIYLRPRVTLGYGAPFWNFVGLDASWMVTNSFTQPAVGWRASLPFLDASMYARWVYPWNRRVMPEAAGHTADDLALQEGDQRSTYHAVDLELSGIAPVPGGALFLSGHPVIIDTPRGVHVYEEVLRAVMAPPFALGLRGGYVYDFGGPFELKVGGMGEYVVLPHRTQNVVRAGPVFLFRLSDSVEGLGAFSVALASPDELGLEHGTYAFLGVLHRFAHRF